MFAKVVRNFAHLHCPNMLTTYHRLKINLYLLGMAQLINQ